jgi:hypothetical protein
MSFIKDMGDAIGSALRGHVGGNVVQGAQTGKTAQQITAMLSGPMRATGRAPQATDLPQRTPTAPVPVIIQNNQGWAPQASKIFPNAPVLKQIAADTARNERLAGRGPDRKTPMGRETTDPAFLRTIAQAGKPPVRGQAKTDKKMVSVLGKLAAVLPGPLKAVVAGMALGVATLKLPGMIRDMGMAHLQSQAKLSRFSGAIARTTALMEVQDIQLGIRQARATGQSTERLGGAVRELRDTMQPYGGFWSSFKQDFSTGVVQFQTDILKIIEKIAFLGQEDRVKKALEGEAADKGPAFEEFLRIMNPPVAQPRNAGVDLRRGAK